MNDFVDRNDRIWLELNCTQIKYNKAAKYNCKLYKVYLFWIVTKFTSTRPLEFREIKILGQLGRQLFKVKPDGSFHFTVYSKELFRGHLL